MELQTVFFFSPENWDPNVNVEYRTISVPYQGADIFEKQNIVVKQTNSYQYWQKVVLAALGWPQDIPKGPRQAPD